MKIAFFEIEDWQKEYMNTLLPGHELSFYPGHITDDHLPDKDTEALCIFLGSQITPDLLDQLPQLKFVATRSTGFDHINLDECKARGITVSNVPAYGENTVAEYTFALILALYRKVFQTIKRVKEEGSFSFEGLRGFDLKGKTIGTVGIGHIGSQVVKIAHGFEMNILAFDRHPNEDLIKEYGVSYVSLEELLKNSDVISLHLPYLPATHHIINAENMQLIKRGALLINTARGPLVDTKAMVLALKDGILGGAALDVLEEEGFIRDELEIVFRGHANEDQLKVALADHALMHMDNVIITPHNAFNTVEALNSILDTTVENLKGFASGSPVNLVGQKN